VSVFKRASGKKEGARAILHVFDGMKCKLEIEVDSNMAEKILEKAVDHSGGITAELKFEGMSIPVEIVGGRIDSFDDVGKRIGGTGVIEFGSLVRRT
jgi:hypothetical protein